MSFTGKWAYSLNGEDYCGEFDSKESAINEALSWNVDKYLICVYVGQVEDVSVKISSDSLFEQLRDDAYDQVGGYSDDFLMYVKREHANRLEEELNNVLHEWMNNFGYKPNFWTVKNAERVNVGNG